MELLDITAVILAGGRGQRMGAQNKGLLPFRQQPLIQHVITRLRGQIPRILISANQDLDAYRQFGLPVVSDLIADYPGPLGGMHAVLRQLETEWLITAPCDTPFLPLDYLQRMQAAMDGHRAYVAHDGERLQTGFCLLHRSVLPALEAALQAGQFAVHRLLAAVAAKPVDFSDQQTAFINFNTPSELDNYDG